MVKKAFEKLDVDRNGYLDVNDIKNFYDASRHPDVKSGKVTSDEVLSNFLETFEAHRGLSKGDA
jgi:Ca2+-binding EF-hand superfamily protein